MVFVAAAVTEIVDKTSKYIMTTYQINDDDYVQLFDNETGGIVFCSTGERANRAKLDQEEDERLKNAEHVDVVKGGLKWDDIPENGHKNSALKAFVQLACKIEHYLRQKKNVLVYCLNGRSRSPSVLLAYFVLFRGYTENSCQLWFLEAFPEQRPTTVPVSPIFPNFYKFQGIADIINKMIRDEDSLLYEIVKQCETKLKIPQKKFVNKIKSYSRDDNEAIIHAYDVDQASPPEDLPESSFAPWYGSKQKGSASAETESITRQVTRSQVAKATGPLMKRPTKLDTSHLEVKKETEDEEKENRVALISPSESSDSEASNYVVSSNGDTQSATTTQDNIATTKPPKAQGSKKRLAVTDPEKYNSQKKKNWKNSSDTSDDKTLEGRASWYWQENLKPCGWRFAAGKHHDHAFIPGQYLHGGYTKKEVKDYGTEGSHYADGWLSLYNMIQKFGIFGEEKGAGDILPILMDYVGPPLPKLPKRPKKSDSKASNERAASKDSIGAPPVSDDLSSPSSNLVQNSTAFNDKDPRGSIGTPPTLCNQPRRSVSVQNSDLRQMESTTFNEMATSSSAGTQPMAVGFDTHLENGTPRTLSQPTPDRITASPAGLPTLRVLRDLPNLRDSSWDDKYGFLHRCYDSIEDKHKQLFRETVESWSIEPAIKALNDSPDNRELSTYKEKSEFVFQLYRTLSPQKKDLLKKNVASW